MLLQNQLSQNDFNSFLLYEDGKLFTRSTAALRVLSQLKGWKWAGVFQWVPPFIRNAVYNLVARNRYKWFGKKDECMIPTPELKNRFLD